MLLQNVAALSLTRSPILRPASRQSSSCFHAKQLQLHCFSEHRLMTCKVSHVNRKGFKRPSETQQLPFDALDTVTSSLGRSAGAPS